VGVTPTKSILDPTDIYVNIKHNNSKRHTQGHFQASWELDNGEDPEIEPGQLWVRVLLPGDRPEEYEQILSAFLA
jgi:hypothetical protein